MPDLAASALVQQLRRIVGDNHVLTDPDLVAGYIRDWTGRFEGHTPAVVRPADAQEVAGVVNVCRDTNCAIVPQGGNTGLVGGSVPLEGEIVMSLTRLGGITDFDEATAQLTSGAGETLAAVQTFAKKHDRRFAIDLAARDSATIGGMVSTNAGGLNVLRYGPMRKQVTGIAAVLASGEIASDIQGLGTNNTGHDLPSLFCGSEGTLGIITAVRLQLVAQSPNRVTALCGFQSAADAISAVSQLLSECANLESLEFLFDNGVQLAHKYGARVPFSSHVYLLAEVADQNDPTTEFAQAVEDLGEAVADVAVATDSAGREGIWSIREKQSEAIATHAVEIGAVIYKYDVFIPLTEIPYFCEQVHSAVSATDADAELYIFGHVAVGNIHVNILSSAGDNFDAPVLDLVVQLGGSISAEHGVGTAKKHWLHLSRSESEIAQLRSLKQSFDPARILNPNVLLP